MRKECNIVEINLLEYIEKKLNKEENEKIEKHLKICQRCKKIYEELKETSEFLGTHKVPEISEDFTERVMQRIRKEKELEVPKKRFLERFQISLMPISCVIIFIILTIFYYYGIFPRLREKPIPREIKITMPGEGAYNPIIIWCEDEKNAYSQLKEIVNSLNGTIVKTYENKIGLGVILKIDKEKEKVFFKEIFKIGMIEKKIGYKDKVGNIVIVIKKSVENSSNIRR